MVNFNGSVSQGEEELTPCYRLNHVLNEFVNEYHTERRRAAASHGSILKRLKQMREELIKGDDESIFQQKKNVMESLAASGAAIQQSLTAHRALVHKATKIGYVIEKEFHKDYSILTYPNASNVLEKSSLDPLIYFHFVFSGDFDVARIFFEEASLNLGGVRASSAKVLLVVNQLETIVSEFDVGRLNTALSFCMENAQEIGKLANRVVYFIKKRQILADIVGGDIISAVATLKSLSDYSTVNLGKDLYDDKKSLVSLLTLESESARSSPHFKLATDEGMDFIKFEFSRAFLQAHLKKPFDSLLECVLAGLHSIDQVYRSAKMCEAVYGKSHTTPYLRRSSLTFPVILEGSRFFYHSVFICPISKSQLSSNERPVAFQCGHVVGKRNANLIKKYQGVCPCCNQPTGESLSVPLIFE